MVEKNIITLASSREPRSLKLDRLNQSLIRKLQTSLDLAELLDIFFSEAADWLSIDRMKYSYQGRNTTLARNEKARHSANYGLKLEGQQLGELTIFRSSKLGADELNDFECMLSALIYPLRNAIRYQAALDLAMRDPLTGIANKMAMDGQLQREIALVFRHAEPMSVIMLDLDFFKMVNDTYGHMAGDAVLMQTATIMQEVCRESDFPFRFGGEEFGIILPKTDAEGASIIAERLRLKIESHRFSFNGATIPCTASFGVSAYKPEDTRSDLLSRADRALYKAKQSGRNKVLIDLG
ncbi:GGDEF domain-containing protein [Allohahella marinimesophila]|uniref:diguanylate cyclase n=2 Tax=Allohahella marinimesophila TaxID=1054972 RepID=A0ABP7QB47_9GAMM